MGLSQETVADTLGVTFQQFQKYEQSAGALYRLAMSAGQTVVQIAGSAWQIQSAKFSEAYKASGRLRTLTNEFQTVLLLQAQQSAACHALHAVEARLCRWLLQSQDVTESDIVPLTQEFLSHMLGVRRTSVSLCAGRVAVNRHADILRLAAIG